MAAASTAALPGTLSIDEYLNTTYRPDIDYVDGYIERRNLGKFDHADLPFEIAGLLRARQKEWSIRVVGENRVRVSPKRVRIPDVCVLESSRKWQQVITNPPLLCIEVLSPRDRLAAMRLRAQDHLEMGVPEVWIFESALRTAYTCTNDSITEHKDGALKLSGTLVELSVLDAFATLDD